MKHHITFCLWSVSLFIFSCSIKKSVFVNNKEITVQNKNETINDIKIVVASKQAETATTATTTINDTTFVNLRNYSPDFVYDMRYSTDDNFLKSKVYDCAECYLRLKTVRALIEANNAFLKKRYRIKLFDCYRPLSIQKKMWKIVSNPEYVADPKKGSIHNRGGAVDLTLVDKNGKELDMGTPFDFFGAKANHNYEKLSDEVKKNRKLLSNTMTHHGFKIFESEWWHYNLANSAKDKLSNFKWDCN